MKRWMKYTLASVLLLLAAIGGAYYWLFVESTAPDDARFVLDVEVLRELANASAGDKPTLVEVENVALFKFPATAVVAGDGFDAVDMPVYSYRVVYPDRSLIVDTALDRAIGGEELAAFDDDAYVRMQNAMTTAAFIVITHEHMDHIGGLTAHPAAATILPKAQLTPAQIADPERSAPARFPDGALASFQPYDYDAITPIAPGVVLIKAPGHTPGSQMVYVQTTRGVEFLFIGDVAWHFRNIDTQRERARLVTWLFLKEDRKAVFGQLAALKRLHAAHPNVHIVPGHDGKIVDALVKSGVLKAQFSLEGTGD